jgi:hypothetical protein
LSDRRIKRDIEEINDDDALNKILLVQPTTYYYRDEARNRGNGKVYGFIAQQIKEVIPDAVHTTKDIIANIYKTCLISNKREIYCSIPQDVPIDTEVVINFNDKGNRYKIKEIYEDHFIIDQDIDTDECFVFGYSIPDLHGINKDYIFTINVCATQELHRRMEEQEKRIKDNYHKIKKLLSTCPYSIEYYNNLYNDDRRVYCHLPFNVDNIPTDFTKKYDVFFSGHVFPDNNFISGYVKIIEKFNHCIVSFNHGNFTGASYKQKIQLNANSKISVVHNCLFNQTNIQFEKVFKNIKDSRFIPQPKGRTLEAAACKSIMLCHFEEFRCVEWYFEPDKDFIYWYNTDDLEEKIHEILNNYEKYTYLADNAFYKLINNWTTHHFFEKYLKNL